ncbi:MAG: serine/threonine-protein kinase [Myxococcota bacterium]
MADHALALTSTGAIPPGTRLGKYEVVKRLRSGGMAEIYLARAHGAADVTQLGVIKRILPHLAEDPDFVRMFLNEAKITASLDHPNIAHVKEVARAGGEFFLALEYIHGVDLQAILRRSARAGGMPRGPALGIISAVANALHYAHERSIVHRDMTPSNVMVTYEGHVKALDFGIAKAVRTAMTRTATIKGKVGYMSPEQCMAEEIDRRTDVFSVGVLLYELTVGRRLFKGDSDFAVMNQIMLGRIVEPMEIDPDYPPDLQRIILKAVAVEPGDRYPTAEALGRDVEDFAHAEGLRTTPSEIAATVVELFGEAPEPITATDLEAIPVAKTQPVFKTSWTSPGQRRTRSRPLMIGVVGGVLGVLVGVGLTGALGGSAEPVAPVTAPVLAPAAPSEREPEPEPTEEPPSVAAPVVEAAAAVPVTAEAPHAEPPVAAAEVEPEPTPKKRRRAPKKRKKKRTKPSASVSAMPPSQRGG